MPFVHCSLPPPFRPRPLSHSAVRALVAAPSLVVPPGFDGPPRRTRGRTRSRAESHRQVPPREPTTGAALCGQCGRRRWRAAEAARESKRSNAAATARHHCTEEQPGALRQTRAWAEGRAGTAQLPTHGRTLLGMFFANEPFSTGLTLLLRLVGATSPPCGQRLHNVAGEAQQVPFQLSRHPARPDGANTLQGVARPCLEAALGLHRAAALGKAAAGHTALQARRLADHAGGSPRYGADCALCMVWAGRGGGGVGLGGGRAAAGDVLVHRLPVLLSGASPSPPPAARAAGNNLPFPAARVPACVPADRPAVCTPHSVFERAGVAVAGLVCSGSTSATQLQCACTPRSGH